jgi:hypothetical protein
VKKERYLKSALKYGRKVVEAMRGWSGKGANFGIGSAEYADYEKEILGDRLASKGSADRARQLLPGFCGTKLHAGIKPTPAGVLPRKGFSNCLWQLL